MRQRAAVGRIIIGSVAVCRHSSEIATCLHYHHRIRKEGRKERRTEGRNKKGEGRKERRTEGRKEGRKE